MTSLSLAPRNSAAALPRVAFVTSHPIQYQVPVFRCLAARNDLEFTVLFAHLPDAAAQGAGFGVAFEWDLPLLDGYAHRVLKNVSKRPSVTEYSGCDTPEIEKVLKELEIDVVVVNGWVVKTCIQTLRACKRLRIPCIVRGEANNLRPRPWWKRILQRQLVRRFDAFLPIGSANREFYLGYGVTEHQLYDAKYCVENARFEATAQAAIARRDSLRQQWQIPPKAACFLFCGKFENKKHPVELLQAFEMACTQVPEARNKTHLLMVGDGVLRAACEQIVKNSQLPVTFTGFLNQGEIVNAYVASDCLALPSDHGETWGLVTNEAMACSRPAIVSNQVGCASDLIQEGVTGFVFPFGDWDALARILVRCSTDDVDLEQMGRKARDRIQLYSPGAAAEGIVQAVTYTLGKHIPARSASK